MIVDWMAGRGCRGRGGGGGGEGGIFRLLDEAVEVRGRRSVAATSG